MLTISTEKDMPVRNINIDDYNANEQCVFKTSGGKTLDPQLKTNSNDGSQMLILEEPKPIVSVACEGTCIGTYGKSFFFPSRLLYAHGMLTD